MYNLVAYILALIAILLRDIWSIISVYHNASFDCYKKWNYVLISHYFKSAGIKIFINVKYS